jgi:RNA polymerase subunit RPABC4/transcription elongation factor Spt4
MLTCPRGDKPSRQKDNTMTEAQLQNMVRSTLALLGYTVLEVGKSRGKQRCPRCGTYAYATGWQGNTVGVPDLYIHAPWWKIPCGIAIELKTETGKVRTEQKNLADQTMTSICRTVECVLAVIIDTERKIGDDTQVIRVERFLNANNKNVSN